MRLTEALNDAGKPVRGSKICMLGIAYKKDVDDPRESPSFELLEMLLARGAEVTYNDPHVPRLPEMRHHHGARDGEPAAGAGISGGAGLRADRDGPLGVRLRVHRATCRLVIDTRNATRNVVEGREKIRKA